MLQPSFPLHEPSPALEIPELPIPPVIELSAAGRVVRKKRLTWKLLQQLPAAPTPVPEVPLAMELDHDIAPPLIEAIVLETITTTCNSFGLYRQYPNKPTHNPDDTIGLQDLTDGTAPKAINEVQPSSTSRLSVIPDDQTSTAQSYFPFQNSTIFGLMNWMWTGSAMKSISEMKNLVNFLKSDQFKKEDLENFDIRAETVKFDKYLDGSSTSHPKQSTESKASSPKDGWRESEVQILVPDQKPHKKEDIPTFAVPGLLHRSIVEIIKATFSDPVSRLFHYTPFKSFFRSDIKESQEQAQRIYDELYTCDAMYDAHEELQKQCSEPGCTLERVVVSMMLWSDSTHLASFGTASLWPIYLYFGNQSKYLRGKPKAGACHHLAYIPKVRTPLFNAGIQAYLMYET